MELLNHPKMKEFKSELENEVTKLIESKKYDFEGKSEKEVRKILSKKIIERLKKEIVNSTKKSTKMR